MPLITRSFDDDKPSGFFCMKLVEFLTATDEIEWFQGFKVAAEGNCFFANRCAIYERTFKKYGHQQSLNFQ